MKILVIGYAHGGTSFTASLFQHFGLDIRHEDYRGADGVSSWPYAVDDDFLNSVLGWKQRGDISQYDIVLHQVRDPLNSIRSVAPEPEWTKIFRKRHLSFFDHDNPLASGLRSWTGWHELCDKIAHWTYKIEDLSNPDIWKKFKELCQLDKNLDYPNLKKNINSKRNKSHGLWKNINNSWENFKKIDPEFAERAYNLAIKYGYKYD